MQMSAPQCTLCEYGGTHPHQHIYQIRSNSYVGAAAVSQLTSKGTASMGVHLCGGKHGPPWMYTLVCERGLKTLNKYLFIHENLPFILHLPYNVTVMC